MKLEDAPARGWYPDPERNGQLRWWEGTDWTATRRPVATASEARATTEPPTKRASTAKPASDALEGRAQVIDPQKFVLEAREAAREEVERAADLFSRRIRVGVDRARSAAAEYVELLVRWLKIGAVVVAVAVIAWFIFQLIVQATLLEWLGDRIDNVTDN